MYIKFVWSSFSARKYRDRNCRKTKSSNQKRNFGIAWMRCTLGKLRDRGCKCYLRGNNRLSMSSMLNQLGKSGTLQGRVYTPEHSGPRMDRYRPSKNQSRRFPRPWNSSFPHKYRRKSSLSKLHSQAGKASTEDWLHYTDIRENTGRRCYRKSINRSGRSRPDNSCLRHRCREDKSLSIGFILIWSRSYWRRRCRCWYRCRLSNRKDRPCRIGRQGRCPQDKNLSIEFHQVGSSNFEGKMYKLLGWYK